MSDNKKLIDLFFRLLATGVVPILIWLNSLSITNALAENKINTLESRVLKIEDEQKKIHDALKDNQGSLREVRVTVEFIKGLLMEIRSEIHNQK